MKPVLTIEYCPNCGWLLSAAYLAHDFLTPFAEAFKSVNLQPSATSGAYKISFNDEIVSERKLHGGFLDIKKLKQLIRDKIAPGKNLGHSDKKPTITNE